MQLLVLVNPKNPSKTDLEINAIIIVNALLYYCYILYAKWSLALDWGFALLSVATVCFYF